MRSLSRRRTRCAPGQDRLHAVEQLLGDKWLEVAALSANAVLGGVHDAGVELLSQQLPNYLRRKRTIAVVRQPQARACSSTCCLVKRPVAYASNKRHTIGARSGSCIKLLPIARGAFR